MGKEQAPNISGLDHVGILVPDIQKAADFYSLTLGIGPFQIFEINVTEEMLRGVTRGQCRPGRLKIGIAPKGKVNIELIEVVEGETVYKEFLDSNGSVLHHLGFEVADLERELAAIEAHGIEVPFSIQHSQGAAALLGGEGTGGSILIELVQATKPLSERLTGMREKP